MSACVLLRTTTASERPSVGREGGAFALVWHYRGEMSDQLPEVAHKMFWDTPVYTTSSAAYTLDLHKWAESLAQPRLKELFYFK